LTASLRGVYNKDTLMIEEEALATTTVRSHSTSVHEDAAYQAYLVLRTGFVVAPILFGLA
jgi:hypothetical protein